MKFPFTSPQRITALLGLLLLVNYAFCRHDCRMNPLENIIRIARKTDTPVETVLVYMKDIDADAYQLLQEQYKNYALCMGSVESGYFKKRSSWKIRSLSLSEPGQPTQKRRPGKTILNFLTRGPGRVLVNEAWQQSKGN